MSDSSNTNSLPSIIDIAKQTAGTIAVTALNVVLPLVTSSLQAIKTTPTPETVVAQGAELGTQIAAHFPELADDEIAALTANAQGLVKDLGEYLVTQAQALEQAGAATE